MQYLDTSNVTTMERMFDWGGNFLTKNDTITITGLENWNTSNTENMYRTFAYMGRNAKKWRIGDISNWDTSKVTTMENMFLYSAYSSDIFDIGNIGKWDVSNVESMKTMFNQVLYYGSRFYIGNLSEWDTRKVTDMSYMFASTAYTAEDFNIGTLNVYADNITSMFSSSKEANAIINIRSNPTSYSSAFSRYTSTYNSHIVVNYSSITTNIDAIVGTNYHNNVSKGSQLD